MNLKQAKDYFELGCIASFTIQRAPMSAGWLLFIEGKSQGYLDTALDKQRVFATVDTALRMVETISGREARGLSIAF
jgi:hypothetical protein